MEKKNGFTLVELLLGVVIAVLVLGGLLSVINYTSNLRETARNKVIAMNAARQKIEQIKYDAQIDFDRTVTQDYDTVAEQVFTPEGFPQESAGRITLTLVNGGSGNLYDVRVVICWRQGGRIIGEDNGFGTGGVALDGRLNGSEDSNNNGLIDSPCTLTTAIRRL